MDQKIEKIVEDQAAGLRVTKHAPHRRIRDVTRVMSFTSGKGGVGKTHTVINTALALAQLGKRVLVLDADLSLANIDVMLGMAPKRTIEHVIAGTASLDEVIVEGPEGVSFIPASSGVDSLVSLDPMQRLLFMEALERGAYGYDYLLIDTSAGIGSDVMHFNSASSEVVCIINEEPTSLTDAYALIKILVQRYQERSVAVVVNNVSNNDHQAKVRAERTFERLQKAVERFLHIQVRYLGYVPSDSLVSECICTQKPILLTYPSSQAGIALTKLARTIDEQFSDRKMKGGMQFFFQDLLQVSAK